MAQVKFKRIEDSTNISNVPIVDGQLIYTKDGKQYIDYETDRVDLVGVDKGTILWTNSSPTENWTAQNITLSSDDYDELTWIFLTNKEYANIISTITIKNYGGIIISLYNGVVRRTITYIDDTTYNISNCTTAEASSSYQGAIIPLYVIGKKTGLFGD